MRIYKNIINGFSCHKIILSMDIHFLSEFNCFDIKINDDVNFCNMWLDNKCRLFMFMTLSMY